MKKYRSALVSETHYSKPLTHRQRANGERGRYVSYGAMDSTMLWCYKHQLHKELRRTDRISCLEGFDDTVFEPMHSHKEKRVRNKVVQIDQPDNKLSSEESFISTMPTIAEEIQPIVEEKKTLQTAKEVPFFWLMLPLIVAVLAILVLGLLS